MPFDLPYGTLLSYSPRGTSEVAATSRGTCGTIKRGDAEYIAKVIQLLHRPQCSGLSGFIDRQAALVPVPRSAPLVANTVWPSKVIADIIVQEGFAARTLPCLARAQAVTKSSSSAPEQRPSVDEHYDSLTVSGGDLFSPTQLVLVDDVLTQGRTTVACARRLIEAYPTAEIKVFAAVRTLGFKEVTEILDPVISVIKYYQSGKTFRTDPDG